MRERFLVATSMIAESVDLTSVRDLQPSIRQTVWTVYMLRLTHPEYNVDVQCPIICSDSDDGDVEMGLHRVGELPLPLEPNYRSSNR